MGSLSNAFGGVPVDLILLGMVAAFLVLRLRSILGRRTGFERPPRSFRPQWAGGSRNGGGGRVIEGQAEPVSPSAPGRRPVPDPASPIGQTLSRMRGLDRSFDPTRFLESAETAFRMIVTAFASGNKEALRPLLTPDTRGVFEQVIEARKAAGETQRTDIKSVHEAKVEGAELRGNLGSITVRFVTDQINLTTGPDGHPVAGTDGLTEITDVWTFERLLGGSDQTWRLAAARSA